MTSASPAGRSPGTRGARNWLSATPHVTRTGSSLSPILPEWARGMGTRRVTRLNWPGGWALTASAGPRCPLCPMPAGSCSPARATPPGPSVRLIPAALSAPPCGPSCQGSRGTGSRRRNRIAADARSVRGPRRRRHGHRGAVLAVGPFAVTGGSEVEGDAAAGGEAVEDGERERGDDRLRGVA